MWWVEWPFFSWRMWSCECFNIQQQSHVSVRVNIHSHLIHSFIAYKTKCFLLYEREPAFLLFMLEVHWWLSWCTNNFRNQTMKFIYFLFEWTIPEKIWIRFYISSLIRKPETSGYTRSDEELSSEASHEHFTTFVTSLCKIIHSVF